jgi:hypothetical protein
MALTYVKSSGIDITGDYTVNNLSATANVTSGYFIGNGSQLTSVAASTATSATTAATVTTAAQPNITSTGTLTSLVVSGLVTATTTGLKIGNIQDPSGTKTIQLTNSDVIVTGDITAGGAGSGNVTATYFIGDGSQLTGVGATITDDTTTDSTYYPLFSTASTGSLTAPKVSSTKLQFNPSSGQLTVQDLNTLSDATLKTNPEVIEDPMAVLSQIFGMGFNWADSGKKSYGVMAQMLEKILPELVSTDANGKKTVNYIPIIAFLVEAVKKQQQDIDDLKKR